MIKRQFYPFILVLAGLGFLASADSPAAAKPIDETKLAPAPMARDYDDISSEDFENTRTLQLKGLQAMRQGAIDRALKHLEKAVAVGPKDVDAHAHYATALEEKMKRMKHPDAQMFSKCVASWTKLYRGEVGEEKGITIKGIGLGSGMFSNDEMVVMGKEHLLSLVGFLPKPWESDAKYIKRAVKAKIEAH